MLLISPSLRSRPNSLHPSWSLMTFDPCAILRSAGLFFLAIPRALGSQKWRKLSASGTMLVCAVWRMFVCVGGCVSVPASDLYAWTSCKFSYGCIWVRRKCCTTLIIYDPFSTRERLNYLLSVWCKPSWFALIPSVHVQRLWLGWCIVLDSEAVTVTSGQQGFADSFISVCVPLLSSSDVLSQQQDTPEVTGALQV